MPKIIRILSKDHFVWRYLVHFLPLNISKVNFWLVIYIAKNFIKTALKAIFSIFWFILHPQILDFQTVVYRPNIADPIKPYINVKLNNSEQLTLKTGFVVRGHIYLKYYFFKYTTSFSEGAAFTVNYLFS